MSKNNWYFALAGLLVVLDFVFNAWSGFGVADGGREIRLPELQLGNQQEQKKSGFHQSFFVAPVLEAQDESALNEQANAESTQNQLKLENPTKLLVEGGVWELLGCATKGELAFAIVRETVDEQSKVITVVAGDVIQGVKVNQVLADSIIVESERVIKENKPIQLYVFNYKTIFAE